MFSGVQVPMMRLCAALTIFAALALLEASAFDAVHVTFAIKPSPDESTLLIFEHALRSVIPEERRTHITVTLQEPTPEAYPARRSFENNLGVYIHPPDDCPSCKADYEEIESRFDYVAVEAIMNENGIDRLEDLLVLGLDAYSGDLQVVSRHTIVSDHHGNEYIVHEVHDDYWATEWLWALLIILFFVVLLVWLAWDTPLYTWRARHKPLPNDCI